MAITRYPFSDANIAIAESTPQPREVWINGPIEVVVRTGADMEQQQESDRYVTAEQFRDRFTIAELDGFLVEQQTDIKVAEFLLLVGTASGPFSLDRQDVIDGLDYLVGNGLLTADRPAQIRK